MKHFILILASLYSYTFIAQDRFNYIPNIGYKNVEDDIGECRTSKPKAFESKFGNATKLKDDTISKMKSHGIYLELLGRNGIYSLGYEVEGNHGVGLGIGTSIYQHSAPGVKFLNYNFNVSPFYDFGENIGIRVGFNTSVSMNPVTFTSDLDFLNPADKPPIYRITPANSLGVYYKTKNQKYQILVSSYLLYEISIYENHNRSQILPWFGLQLKYNFKSN